MEKENKENLLIGRLVKRFNTTKIEINIELKYLNNAGSILNELQLYELVEFCDNYDDPVERFFEAAKKFVEFFDKKFGEKIVYVANVTDISFDIVRKFTIYDFLKDPKIRKELKKDRKININLPYMFGFSSIVSNDLEDKLIAILQNKLLSFPAIQETFRSMLTNEIFREKIKYLTLRQQNKLIESILKNSGIRALSINPLLNIVSNRVTLIKCINESIQHKDSTKKIRKFNQEGENWFMYFVIKHLKTEGVDFNYEKLVPFFKPLKQNINKTKIGARFKDCMDAIDNKQNLTEVQKGKIRFEKLSKFKINKIYINQTVKVIKNKIKPELNTEGIALINNGREEKIGGSLLRYSQYLKFFTEPDKKPKKTTKGINSLKGYDKYLKDFEKALTDILKDKSKSTDYVSEYYPSTKEIKYRKLKKGEKL